MSQLRDYLQNLGTGDVTHVSGEAFYNHLTAVEETMQSLTDDRDLINAGLFHSIYGTEGFQAFTVPLSKRPEIRGLIGDRAESICYVNCVMDRATLDAAVTQNQETSTLNARPEVGGQEIRLNRHQFLDLIAVHLGDWLQQVEMEAAHTNEAHGWTRKGDAWGYRRHAYQRMADILGGRYLALYKDVFGREPMETREIHQRFHPKPKQLASAA